MILLDFLRFSSGFSMFHCRPAGYKTKQTGQDSGHTMLTGMHTGAVKTVESTTDLHLQ